MPQPYALGSDTMMFPIGHLIYPVKIVSPDCNRDCRNRVQESTRLRQAANDKYFKRLEFNFVKN